MNKDTQIIFVLFGATGDLAQKKILPSLYNLYKHGEISPSSAIIAFSRRDWKDEDYRAFAQPFIETDKDEKTVELFLKQVKYLKGTFDQADAYSQLKHTIDELQKTFAQPVQTIFHIAIQPEFYGTVFKELGKAGIGQIDQTSAQTKIIIEKPFGSDTDSALNLEKIINEFFSEDQIYRIDHYLGKEGLRVLYDERKNNPEFERSLSSEFVDSILFKMTETLDIQGRGEFYEQNGALRDVGQNHVLEMVAVATADISDSQNTIGSARSEVLKSLHQVNERFIKECVIRGQYEGYIQEKEVNPQSQIETYFKITTQLQTQRWNNVKIILEGGKALSKREASITINYKDGIQKVFDIQKPITLRSPDAYEVLILEAIEGKKEWFVSMDEVIASWNFISPIIEKFAVTPLHIYKKGIDPEQIKN